jgi:hypothetical protein
MKEDLWNDIQLGARYLDDLVIITKNRSWNWISIQKEMYDDTIELEDNSIEGNRDGIFLDIKLSFDTEGYLYYKLYRKPGNAYQYIHVKSYIPEHIKANFISNETMRIRKRCKRDTDFVKELRFFKQQLELRGYAQQFISKHTFIEEEKKGKNTSQQFNQYDKELLIIPYNHTLKKQLTEEQKKKYTVVFSNQPKLHNILK